jgi:hypothetical protein
MALASLPDIHKGRTLNARLSQKPFIVTDEGQLAGVRGSLHGTGACGLTDGTQPRLPGIQIAQY